MTEIMVLNTTRGPVTLRPEQAGDTDFLYTLFQSHMLDELALMPVDAATKQALVRMQFGSQTTTYRTNYPDARFDIVEQDGTPIGRLIVDAANDPGCVVDFALLPASRGGGLGTAILAAVLAGHTRPVRCKVLCTNEPSFRMCTRVGFVEISRDLPFIQLEWRPDSN